MTPIDPFRDFQTFRRELNQLFNTVSPTASGNRYFVPVASTNYPYLNVQDLPEQLIVEALAPGLDPEKIEVTVQNNELSITGEKRTEIAQGKPDNWYLNERRSGKFIRTFNLPTPVEENAVNATYKNGVLRVVLPKREEVKPKRITVSVA